MVTPTDETPILLAQAGPLEGQQWLIGKEVVLGRDSACEIVIPSRQVSRHHARLVRQKIGFALEDLGSKNGTHLNGTQIEGLVPLSDGDVILIALAQEFVYISADSTVPLGELPVQERKPHGRLHLDRRARRVWIGGTELTPSLSVAQFRVLDLLFSHEGRVVSRDRLTEEIWGEDGAIDVSAQALDALIRRLRSRLAQVDSKHDYIRTVRGHGLRLDNPER